MLTVENMIMYKCFSFLLCFILVDINVRAIISSTSGRRGGSLLLWRWSGSSTTPGPTTSYPIAEVSSLLKVLPSFRIIIKKYETLDGSWTSLNQPKYNISRRSRKGYKNLHSFFICWKELNAIICRIHPLQQGWDTFTPAMLTNTFRRVTMHYVQHINMNGP